MSSTGEDVPASVTIIGRSNLICGWPVWAAGFRVRCSLNWTALRRLLSPAETVAETAGQV